MYSDIGLTTPLTGYTFIADNSGNIYQINSGTGVVGADTGSDCVAGTAGSYKLDNSTGTVCSASSVTLYTNGVFAVGSILYTDISLTTPQTGFAYVVYSNVIYNLNSVTGQIGSSTGLSCTPLVTIQNNTVDGGMQTQNGITGFAAQSVTPMTTVTGTHSGFTSAIEIVFAIPASASTVLRSFKNGTQVDFISIAGGDGTNKTFSSQTYSTTDILLITWA